MEAGSIVYTLGIDDQDLQEKIKEAQAAIENFDAIVEQCNGDYSEAWNQMLSVVNVAITGINNKIRENDKTLEELAEGGIKDAEQAYVDAGGGISGAIDSIKAKLSSIKEMSAVGLDSSNLERTGQALERSVELIQENIDATNENANANTRASASTNEMANAQSNQVSVLSSVFGGQKKYSELMNAMPPMMKNAVAGVQGFIKVLRLLVATPVGMVIIAIALAIKGLMSYFKGTTEGATAFAKIMGVIDGVMETLGQVLKDIGKLIYDGLVSGFEALSKWWGQFDAKPFLEMLNPLDRLKTLFNDIQNLTFDDIIESGKNFIEFLKNELIARVEAFTNAWKSVGKSIVALFSDTEEGGKSAFDHIKDAGNSAVQGLTGLTAKQVSDGFTKAGEIVKGAYDKMTDAATKYGDMMARNIKIGQQIRLDEEKLAKDRSKWEIEGARLSARNNTLRSQVYTGTKQSIIKAGEEIMDNIRKQYSQELAFAQKEVDIQKMRMSMSDSSNEDYEKLHKLQANVMNLNAKMMAEIASVKRRIVTAEKEAIYQDTQARIDAMEDGYLKEKAARELKLQKEIDDIERAKDEYIEAERLNNISMGKANEEIDTSSFDQETKRVKDKYAAEESNTNKDTVRNFDAIAAAYTKFQDDMLRLNAARLTAQTEDEVKAIEEAKNRRIQSYIQEIEQEKLARIEAQQDTVLAPYSSYADQSKVANDKFDELERYAQSVEASQETIDELKRMREETLNEIAVTIAEREVSFEQWASQLSNISLTALKKMLMQARANLKQLESQVGIDSKKIAKARAEIKKIEDAMQSKELELPETVEEAWKDLSKQLKSTAKVLNDLGEPFSNVVGNAMSAAATIGDTVFSTINNIQNVVDIASKAMETSSATAATAIKAVESATVILAIIEAIITVIQAMVGIFKKSYEVSEETITMYNNQMESIDKLIDKQEELLESTSALNAVLYGDKLREYYQQQIKLAANMAKEYAKEYDKTHSLNYQLSVANADYGVNAKQYSLRGIVDISKLNNMDDILNMVQTMDDATWNKFHASEWWAAFASASKDAATQVELVREKVEALNDIDDLVLKANIQTDVETLRDDLLDLATDWETTMQDVADTFEEAMSNAIKAVVRDKYLSTQMENWANKFSDYMSDGTLTDAEASELRDEYMNYYQTATDAYRKAAEAAGLYEEEIENQTLSGAIANASQESIDLLAGQTNAVRMNQVEAMEIMRDQLLVMSGIMNQAEISNGYLSSIDRHLSAPNTTDGLRASGVMN
ncbi:MAG: hypothetical protein HUJ96_02870 [Marinilabiliaceae bacterium]|mgnify:CR=1 FL=1|nr:hypothetical protein [Marinilabiliaceae bacterium]